MEIDVSSTSSNHEWFKNITDRRLYYVATGNREETWTSRDGYSAWTKFTDDSNYYYGGRQNQNLQLDFKSKEVVDSVLDSLKFWLDMGISGFSLQNTAFIFGSRSSYNVLTDLEPLDRISIMPVRSLICISYI